MGLGQLKSFQNNVKEQKIVNYYIPANFLKEENFSPSRKFIDTHV